MKMFLNVFLMIVVITIVILSGICKPGEQRIVIQHHNRNILYNYHTRKTRSSRIGYY
ncbi:hypothetical protein CAJAP_02330 [Camponotus japonicus]